MPPSGNYAAEGWDDFFYMAALVWGDCRQPVCKLILLLLGLTDSTIGESLCLFLSLYRPLSLYVSLFMSVSLTLSLFFCSLSQSL